MINKAYQGIGMTSRRTRERLVAKLESVGIRDRRVLQAMREVPRHVFIDEALASRAYENSALPIGHGQTISQPYIVARMTELLIESGLPERVLEVGTGSGYQTAILASLVESVFSVERIRPLQDKAKLIIKELGFRNVVFRHTDGGWGWREYGPYDAILAAAAPESIPEPLLEQLKLGGVLVMPVGPDGRQVLQRVTRTESAFEVETFEPVAFVPFLPGRI